MIELNIIKEQYERMSDEELQVFAINESDKLTMDSFHLLKDEFERRKLDLGIIESVQIDQALADVNKQTTFEQITAFEFTESIWKGALDEKASGKTNMEIYHNLLNKGVAEGYAFMVVQSLDTKSKELKENYSSIIFAEWVVFFIGILCILLALSGTISGIMLLWGILIVAGCSVRLYGSYAKHNKYQKVSKNIEAEIQNVKDN